MMKFRVGTPAEDGSGRILQCTLDTAEKRILASCMRHFFNSFLRFSFVPFRLHSFSTVYSGGGCVHPVFGCLSANSCKCMCSLGVVV